jgi:hypothetical protein
MTVDEFKKLLESSKEILEFVESTWIYMRRYSVRCRDSCVFCLLLNEAVRIRCMNTKLNGIENEFWIEFQKAFKMFVRNHRRLRGFFVKIPHSSHKCNEQFDDKKQNDNNSRNIAKKYFCKKLYITKIRNIALKNAKKFIQKLS